MLCTGLAGVIRCLYEALEGVTKTPLCLSRCLHSVSNSQQPTPPPTATHRQPSPNTQHPHRAAHRHATVSASRKGLPSCPCLEIAFAPQTLGFVTLYPSQFPRSCLPAGCALCFVISHPQPASPACFSHRANFLAGWCHREASLTRLRDSISCLLQSSLVTRSSSAILVFAHHRNPGACVANPHLACFRQDSDVIPHKLDRYRYHPRRIFLNHGGYCDTFARRGICPDERPSERPDLTESHTIVDVGRLAQKFNQRCTWIHAGNTTQQWRRS